MFTDIVMHIQHVLSGKCFVTILALMEESVGEMDVFNMLPQITLVIGNFATQVAH